jgi:capsular exopolysaccharide synthesis family protein
MYKGETTLFIGKEENDIGISLNELNRNNVLINDYKNIAQSRLIINQVMKNLGFSIELEKFKKRMAIEVLEDSRLFIVSYKSESPKIARDVANELAEQLSVGVLEIVGVKNIRIIDKALLPKEYETPNVLKNTIFGGIIGLVTSLIVFLILFVKNDTIRDIELIERTLKIPLIGTIPSLTKSRNKKKENSTMSFEENSYFSESYKMLRSNINYIKSSQDSKILMFTSSATSEGKSTTIGNLAVSMANEGKKVLLIDGDLRKPKLHENFNLKQIPGLTTILYKEKNINQVKNKILGKEYLEILTSGPLPPSPDVILGSDAFKSFLNEIKDNYDYILIDAPPVLYVSDPMVLSQIVDGIVLVAAINETSNKDLKRSKAMLEKVDANIIGLILTKTPHDYEKSYYYDGN